MPNYVTHKLIFDAEHLDAVVSECCPNGRFDFALLIPFPLQMYRGDLSSQDESDFPCNWHRWRVENWGVKWNVMQTATGTENEKAFLQFDTAWSIPYPIITALANKYQFAFEHRYFDEGRNFWGVETWQMVDGRMKRTMKRQSAEEDKAPLCIELKGYDPDAPDDDEDA